MCRGLGLGSERQQDRSVGDSFSSLLEGAGLGGFGLRLQVCVMDLSRSGELNEV